MTSPSAPERPVAPWYVRPRLVLPAISALVIAVALVTPTTVGSRSGDARLSSLSSAPLGAQLFHELSQRLGWQPERRMNNVLERHPSVIHAVMDPAIPLRATETHELLEHVREGGGLLLVLGGGSSAFEDSLGIARGSSGLIADRVDSGKQDDLDCPEDDGGRFAALWPGATASLWTIEWRRPARGFVDTLLTVKETVRERRTSFERDNPAMLALELGAGRIVVASDPDIFRNDAVRDCRFGLGIAAVRALEFLSAGGETPRRRLVFDEYHQGHGARPGSLGAVAAYLRGTPSGRLLFQLSIAGLIMLAALAPRIVAPQDPGRLERRSPLEQVDALARAYALVGATRTSTRRLVRGLRRRVERAQRAERAPAGSHAGARADADDRFLDRIEALVPSLHTDVALLRRALSTPLPVAQFAAIGPALLRVESTLMRSNKKRS
ncbi:MAG TPA: DUF4350 domain-containing protein [Gemmatimonadaceae bacterium]|nr:DUF4350 domain-containing protein [Gemmatimonadaceae bacterium]